jgi:hypothetical protein
VIRRGASGAVLAAALCLGAAPCFADARADAQALLAEGNRAAAARDWSTALSRFEAAYRIFPSAKILLNQGTMLRALGRNADAANAYQSYLESSEADPRKKAEAEELLRDLDTRVARLRVELGAPAAVRIDGRAVGDGTTVSLRVEPGDHVLIAQPRTGAAVERRFSARAGEMHTLELAAPPPPAPASSARAPGDAQAADRDQDPRSTQRLLGFIGIGAGAAGAVAGSVLGVIAANKDSEASGYCVGDGTRCSPEGTALGEDARSLALGSTLCFIGAGVLAAGGLTLLLTAPGKESASARTELRIAPAGASLRGRF